MSEIGNLYFRAGHSLSDPINTRLTPGTSPSAIVKRDLGRYYDVIGHTMESIAPFTENEASALVASTKGRVFDEDTSPFFWAMVDEGFRKDGLAAAWEVDGNAIIERIRGLSEPQKTALIDATERAWTALSRGLLLSEVVKMVGLVRR